jgi:hypothetical protein
MRPDLVSRIVRDCVGDSRDRHMQSRARTIKKIDEIMVVYMGKNKVFPSEIILVSELERKLIGEGIRSSGSGIRCSHGRKRKKRTKIQILNKLGVSQ